MRRRAAGEEGFALLAVMVLMGVMLTTGLAIASTVDTQTRASRVERVRDSAFNLAESALNAQVFRLTADWPGRGKLTAPYLTCTEVSVTARCPDRASLLGGVSADLNPTATWKTTVLDNGVPNVPNFFSDSSLAQQQQPGYDASGIDNKPDGKLWVRAEARSQGKTRILVALVSVEKQEEDLPHAALVAGSLDISNNGNKELVAAGSGGVSVRCDPLGASAGQSCLGHPVSNQNDLQNLLNGRLAAQVTGSKLPVYGYQGGPAMTAEARARLKATAMADGNYFGSACPTAAELTAAKDKGSIVYVDASGTCSYTGNSQFFSAAAPGVLILDHALLSLGGTTNFFGVVYAANSLGLAGGIISTQGNSQINGGVLIDGANGQFVVGSSGDNIVFDLNAYRAVASYGTAGVVQNTWREITGG